MKPSLMLSPLPALFATAALAASDPHAGHQSPAEAAGPDPQAGYVTSPSTAADPHAGHAAGAHPPQAEAGLEHAPTGADLPVGDAPAPRPPARPLADAVFGTQAMERARSILRSEHGGVRWSRIMVNRLEVRPGAGTDGYAWDAEFRYGGDINRFVGKTEGEGAIDGDFDGAEVQALYSRAIGPYFDLQAGVRHDVRPGADRTYVTVGVEGLAPYWFDVEGAVFLSDKGDLSARVETTYDLRLTQRLILQPSAELDVSASATPELGVGAGLSSAEVGLRLRYELRREFAPYLGVHYTAKLGETADLARAAGEDMSDLRVVAGLRVWF